MVDNYFLKIFKWLFYLLPFFLLTGPFLPNLSVSVIVFIYLFICITTKKWSYFNNYFFYFFIIFYFFLLAASFNSSDILNSLRGSLFYFRYGIFAIAVYHLLDIDNLVAKRFYYFLLISFLIAILDGVIQYFFYENIFNIVSPDNRLTLLLSDDLLLGSFLSRLFPLLIALFISNKFLQNKINIFLIFIIFILIDLLVFISGERTALGLMAISTVMIILFVRSYKIVRILTFIVSISLMYFIAINNPIIKNRVVDQTVNEMNLNIQSDDRVYLISKNHESLFNTGIKMFKEHPIMGIGPRLFRIECRDDKYFVSEDSCSTHPHNSYIQILAELGLFGFLFIILPLGYILYKLLNRIPFLPFSKSNNSDDYEMCLIICISLSLFPFLPTLSIFNSWVNIIYYLPIGFLLHCTRSHKERN